MSGLIDIGDVARMLNDRIDQLAPILLPGGYRDGPEWRAGSVAGERGKSLAVRISGSRRGVWQDFSNNEHTGDALDLVAWCLFVGDKKKGLAWAKSWLGLGGESHKALEQRRSEVRALAQKSDEAARRESESKIKIAKAIWMGAEIDVLGSPVDFYLAGRGIHLGELPRVPRAIRFAPACRYSDGRYFPAMVGMVIGHDGQMLACHRTFLDKRNGVWKKADVEKAKMVLGPYRGGFIPLNRGASGKPIGQAPNGETVIIGEGIETSLSLAVACPEYRVLAAVSVGNFGAITLPPAIHRVILALDNDGENSQSARAVENAIRKFQNDGCEVRTMMPDAGMDFNDVLQVGGA